MALIAVTGSSGFLGGQVVAELLRRGHRVRGLDATPGRDERPSEFEEHTLDLRDGEAARQALTGCDGVVHLAGYPRAGDHSPGEVFDTNTAITFAVVQAVLDLQIPALAYVSSVSVLGYPFFTVPIAPEYLPLDEGATTTPQDAYGLSKAVGEQIIQAAVDQAGGGLSAVSLRMPWLQSPASFWRDIPASATDGSDADNLFAYLDTRDAAAAIASVFGRELTGHAHVFVAADDTFSRLPTMELIQQHFAGVPVSGPLDGHRSLIDSTAAKELLGWTPEWSWRSYPEEIVE